MNRRELLAGAVTVPSLALAQKADWKPLTFDAHQNETVIILTDLIVPTTDTPGAKEANVNRYIDLLVTDGPDRQREIVLAGLGRLDQVANATHGKPFKSCTREQQTAILQQADDGNASPDLVDFFKQFKGLTTRIYYNTEIGYKELNKGGRVPRSFACKA